VTQEELALVLMAEVIIICIGGILVTLLYRDFYRTLMRSDAKCKYLPVLNPDLLLIALGSSFLKLGITLVRASTTGLTHNYVTPTDRWYLYRLEGGVTDSFA
jgi:hypothetical protein